MWLLSFLALAATIAGIVWFLWGAAKNARIARSAKEAHKILATMLPTGTHQQLMNYAAKKKDTHVTRTVLAYLELSKALGKDTTKYHGHVETLHHSDTPRA